MHRSLRRTAFAATALVAGLGLAITTTGSASAASHVLSSCSGTKKYDKTQSDYHGGSVRLRIYYSSSHGGRTCVTAYKGGSIKGKATYIHLSINFTGYDGTSWPKFDDDDGNYKTFAGAVYLDNSHGKKIDTSAGWEPSTGGPEAYIAKYGYKAG